MSSRARKPTGRKASPKGLSPATTRRATPVQQCAKAAARECWKRVSRLSVAVADGKTMAFHLIGQHLNNASPSLRSETYAQHLAATFIAEWRRLGGFRLSLTGVKYCRQFARKLAGKQLQEALRAGATWTELRQMSRNTD